MSLADTTREILWFQQLLQAFHIEVTTTAKSAIYIATNPVFHERTKHVELDCYIVHNRCFMSAPPLPLPQATRTRLPRGRHGRPVPRLSGSPRGDQLLVLPGRHGAVGATLTDNPPVMFNIPLMLPLENYDKTTKVRLSTNSNGPCETTMVNLNRVGRIAGLSIQQRRRRIENTFSENNP